MRLFLSLLATSADLSRLQQISWTQSQRPTLRVPSRQRSLTLLLLRRTSRCGPRRHHSFPFPSHRLHQSLLLSLRPLPSPRPTTRRPRNASRRDRPIQAMRPLQSMPLLKRLHPTRSTPRPRPRRRALLPATSRLLRFSRRGHHRSPATSAGTSMEHRPIASRCARFSAGRPQVSSDQEAPRAAARRRRTRWRSTR